MFGTCSSFNYCSVCYVWVYQILLNRMQNQTFVEPNVNHFNNWSLEHCLLCPRDDPEVTYGPNHKLHASVYNWSSSSPFERRSSSGWGDWKQRSSKQEGMLNPFQVTIAPHPQHVHLIIFRCIFGNSSLKCVCYFEGDQTIYFDSYLWRFFPILLQYFKHIQIPSQEGRNSGLWVYKCSESVDEKGGGCLRIGAPLSCQISWLYRVHNAFCTTCSSSVRIACESFYLKSWTGLSVSVLKRHDSTL